MDLITPEWGLIFWTGLSFLILLFLLGKFAWKPILKSVNDREDSIKDALSEANKARQEMRELKTDNEKILKEARTQRDALLREAREIKETIIGEAKEEAKTQANKLVEQAKTTIQNEKLAAITELKNQVAELSINIAEKVVSEKFSGQEKQEKLIDQLLDDVKLN